jgi:hypothetical protein
VAEQSDVKVFVSWSGDLAKAVAVGLREWLPLLFDRVAPWASDTDIAAGQRGLPQIEAELKDTRFGVVVVTAENQHAPWLNFEAGALSKTVPGDLDQRVVPLLVDLAGPTQLTGPLAQFQAKTAQKTGVRDLVRSLAAVAGIAEHVADARFEAYWPQLDTKIVAAVEAASAAAGEPAEKQAERPEADVLDEILLHVRALRADEVRGAPSANASYRRFVERLAARHGLKLSEIRYGPGHVPISLHLEPVGEYTKAGEEGFERDYRATAVGDDANAQISVVPF